MMNLHSRATSIALVFVAAGCRPAVESPATSPLPRREVPQYSIEDFLATTSFTGASFSPDDGKILVNSNATGVFNAYAIPVSGGDPVQLTRSSTNSIFANSYFPADERFIYSSDQGGNELTHIYVRELDGTVKDITPGDKLKANFLGWADDDRSFFISSNERDPRYFDVYEVAIDGYRRSPVYRDTTGFSVADISADRRYVALEKTNVRTDSDVYVFDRQAGTLTHATPHTGDVHNSPQEFTPDGRGLYVITDEGSDFDYLVRQDLATGTRTIIDKTAWDVAYATFSRDEKYMIVGINADARTELHVYDASFKRIDLPEVPDADITSAIFSPRGQRIAYYASSSRSPSDLFVYDRASRTSKQLTRSLSPKIDSRHLVDARIVRFKSYDGVEVPGLLYQPRQASSSGKVPALVWVHGGPGGQSRIGYSPLIQYLVNHGYAIYAINNRGSSGYGKKFYGMDDRKHGDADLGDCVASKDMLARTGYVDAKRIGIIGGSYGGYMVAAALTFRPEEFAVGVNLYGVTNWLRTLESIPSWWEASRKSLYAELGDPAVDREYLRKISPLFHAKNIAKPLIVLQGANDPRVLKVESDELVAAARANGVPVEYVVFPDEGHGFVKKANQLKAYRAVLDFLDTYLKARD